jgi:hypothetical protein
MKLPAMREALSQFELANRSLISPEHSEWLPSVDARWLDQTSTQFNDRRGIYFYTRVGGDILYIGKAQDCSLSQRIWSHLRTPSVDRFQSTDRVGLILYPKHQWSESQSPDIAPLLPYLQNGEIQVEALEVRPHHLAGLFESFALTFCQLIDQHLPPLNQKLG